MPWFSSHGLCSVGSHRKPRRCSGELKEGSAAAGKSWARACASAGQVVPAVPAARDARGSSASPAPSSHRCPRPRPGQRATQAAAAHGPRRPRLNARLRAELPRRARNVRVIIKVNNCLQLVIQTSSIADKNKPFEFRINKEQSSFHNRLLQHDLEKNYSGRQDNTTNFGSSSPITTFPVLQRTAEEKILNSDRLTLERQKLTVCPIIDGEDHLRLLNFQHNFITRIQNISNLQHLVFLDLYDNQIEEISGLSTLRSLRVLLLGKNRIKKISNLENLKNLDVLDLHGNQITKIENINHLGELRVLNLARNLLTIVENISGLDSLTELNLRHNQVSAIKDVDTLPCLQRLFLSFNNISSFEDILCLADSSSLSDITLDGNPIAQETWYKHTVLHHMMQLRQLDMKRITEEERRMASVAARKEEERKRESHRQTLLKEKKRLTICNIAHQWEIQQNRVALVASLNQDKDNEPCQINGSATYVFPEESRSLDTILSSAVQSLSVLESHLVEVEGDTLYLYGSGALECLDRNWSVQTAGTVVTVCFMFIEFDEIVQVLTKLKIKFPNSVHLKFKETNLVALQQFNALAQVNRIEQLTVDPQGNPVVSFTLWKYYVLFRLNHFNLQKINGIEVTQNDIVMAERLFGVLAYVASSELPHYRVLSLLGESRRKQFHYLLEGKGKKSGVGNEESNDNRRAGVESIARATLNYTTKDFHMEKLEEMKERKTLCQTYVENLVKEAADINMKNESLQKLWPQMFIELVRDAVIEIRNKNSYMKLCLQRIADEK
ncbi:leucine-rich repeat-containing protein 49 isoform X1 [Struthio camelus]|uniref:leucine-rich repeat-containing protein 49 isoform X1 n=1 Tax=Struthio camelus TaxID=8801 RepID=UPI003603AD8F